jgi:hypothetical protein
LGVGGWGLGVGGWGLGVGGWGGGRTSAGHLARYRLVGCCDYTAGSRVRAGLRRPTLCTTAAQRGLLTACAVTRHSSARHPPQEECGHGHSGRTRARAGRQAPRSKNTAGARCKQRAGAARRPWRAKAHRLRSSEAENPSSAIFLGCSGGCGCAGKLSKFPPPTRCLLSLI